MIYARPRFNAASVNVIFKITRVFLWSHLLVVLTSVSAVFGKTSVTEGFFLGPKKNVNRGLAVWALGTRTYSF